MPPKLAAPNPIDQPHADAKAIGYVACTLVRCPDFPCSVGRELRVPPSLSALEAVRVKAGSMSLTDGCSGLFGAIVHVVLVGTKEEMIRVNAGRVVALVQDAEASRNGTSQQ